MVKPHPIIAPGPYFNIRSRKMKSEKLLFASEFASAESA
jgi:hypothetical protein